MKTARDARSAYSPLRACAVAPALLLTPLIAHAAEADCAATETQAAQIERGREAFEICQPCHDIGSGAENRTGPLLNDLFGRAAGHVEGYPSSMPMVFAGERGLVWTEETLGAYLDDPIKLVPGSEMPLIGVEDEAEAKDLIAFLKVASIGCGDLKARPSAVLHRSAPREFGP
ncbi:MAG: cytochrome c family protein [Pseudomonadota bacterium]